MIWGKQFLTGTIGLFLPCAIVLCTVLACLIVPSVSALWAQQPAPDRLPAIVDGAGSYNNPFPRLTGLMQDSIVQGASTYLEPNYPNPFRSTTHIAYSLAEATPVRLRIYDFFFYPVETLVDGSETAGRHEVHYTPRGISSGMYFYELKTNQGVELKRMLYIK